MTGIERLREFAKGCRLTGQKAYSNAIGDIADQIEREQACDGDTAENIRLIVGGVVDEMERHVLGHEGMEDSPVARWARELREALGGHVEEVTDVATIYKDAYDAYEWVFEHGGLDAVKRDAACWNTAENIAQTTLGWLARVCPVAGIEKCGYGVALEKLEDAINRRLMPEGMEWPRFEDGEPVKFGDMALIDGEDDMVEAVQLWIHGKPVIYGDGGSQQLERGERVKRPAPKVLDADGVEIRVGDTVWHVHDLEKFTVTNPNNGENLSVSCMGEDGNEYCCYPNGLTHRAPVIAADGRPLREWETVWSVDSGTRYTVEKITDELIPIKCRSEMGTTVSLHTSQLTHERPDTRARVIDGMGEETVERIDRLVKDGRWLDD